MLFSFDKVKTGTYNFVSVILNSNPVGTTIAVLPPFLHLSLSYQPKTQFFGQVTINSTS